MLRDHSPSCNEESVLLEGSTIPLLSTFDLYPCAMVFWSAQRSECVLNMEARQLTGFSTSDVRNNPSLWISRIHEQDRALFVAARERLQDREKKVQCDYRFSPSGSREEIWLREVSSPYLEPRSQVGGVLSMYTDISDLKKKYRAKDREIGKEGPREEVIEEFVHAAQNSLQSISIGLDLLRITHGDSLESETIFRGVERSSRLLREIREYFTQPDTRLSTEQPETALNEVMQKVEKKWCTQGRRLGIAYGTPFPPLRLDWRQFRNTLERVLDFSFAIIPQEGQVSIEAGLQEIGYQRYMELKITLSAASSVDSKEVFRPFLRVNGYEVGLSLVLVQKMLQRNNGEIAFRQDGQHHGVFTILLKAH